MPINTTVVERLAAAERIWCEHEARALLAELGIAEFTGKLATSAEQAAAAAVEYAQPVALKVQSPDISHKAGAGGVMLDVHGADAARTAYREVIERAGHNKPDADVHGVLVTPMCASGVELILGINRDADFGAMLLIGAGSVLFARRS